MRDEGTEARRHEGWGCAPFNGGRCSARVENPCHGEGARSFSESVRGDEYIPHSRTRDRQECLPHPMQECLPHQVRMRLPLRARCRLEDLHHNGFRCAACAGLEACTTRGRTWGSAPTNAVFAFGSQPGAEVPHEFLGFSLRAFVPACLRAS